MQPAAFRQKNSPNQDIIKAIINQMKKQISAPSSASLARSAGNIFEHCFSPV